MFTLPSLNQRGSDIQHRFEAGGLNCTPELLNCEPLLVQLLIIGPQLIIEVLVIYMYVCAGPVGDEP
jgi:hypothetical protein